MGCGCNKVVPDDDATLVNVVNEAYSKISREGADQAYADRVANAFGYSAEQLQSVPAEAHIGLSCGNPVATATIREGETVVDLGAGGGIDVFLAATKVGPTGQVDVYFHHATRLIYPHDEILRARDALHTLQSNELAKVLFK